MKRDFRLEIIQVAAVAVAILQDMEDGRADIEKPSRERVIDWIVVERSRQDEKWGAQHHDILEWMVILTEELGEAAQAALSDHFMHSRVRKTK